MKVGVLALQGAFAAHVSMLSALGVAAFEVRTARELAEADRLVLPGGESTTMSMMLQRSGLLGPLRDHLEAGRPTFGTCAGAILLGQRILDGRDDQVSLGALGIDVQRNAFGSQRESFEVDLAVAGLEAPFRAVFIRAPKITSVGDGIEVLAELDGSPALVRRGTLMASTFHPELAGDARLHAMFCGGG